MKQKDIYKLLVVIASVTLVNVFIFLTDVEMSSSPKETYELDIASQKLVKNIDKPIIITFFRSNNLNPAEKRFADRVEEVLKAYEEYVDTTLNVDVVNPTESLETELDATNSGIKSIEIRGEDNELRRIFLGMIIQVGSRTEVLPMINPKKGIEYLISSSLRKLIEAKRRKIAYVKGHHEPALQKIRSVEKLLRPNYDLIPVKLQASIDIRAYESVVIVSPVLPFTNTELEVLDRFMKEGKNIFIALDRVGYDSDVQGAYSIDTHLEDWLRRKGILVADEFIVDNSCGDVQLEGVATPITFPYFPQITDFAMHPINNGVGVVVLKYASPIFSMRNLRGVYTPLAKTSSVSGRKGLPLHINLEYEWTIRDYNASEQVVAALVEMEETPKSKKGSKIIVVSDADIVLDNENIKNLVDNHLFVTNAIDWLSDSLGLVLIKNKGIVSHNNKEWVKTPETWVRFINLLFPLVVIGFFAFYKLYIQRRRKEREQRADL